MFPLSLPALNTTFKIRVWQIQDPQSDSMLYSEIF